ncbi:nucleoside-diphosphate sugar epimerase/dehydratase [Pyruvatibacter sp. HU-CL02332]|uniref:polysaccharide biosynthesis protein n=1 Tax=Pyruvatibacter sp. HU-CL02332 TaxID=3127650 RepID=UPI00310798ED
MAGLNEKTLRRAVISAHDLGAAILAYPIAVFLRLGREAADHDPIVLGQAWLLFVIVAMGVMAGTRLDRGSWRYASIDDAFRIGRVSVIANMIFLLALFLLFRAEAIPRSVVLINIFVFAALLAGPRLLYRAYRDGRMATLLERGTHWRIPVLIVGAGDQAEAFHRQMLRDTDAPYRVIGILDDDPARIGTTIRGVRVHGPLAELAEITSKLERRGARPERLVLTADYEGSASRSDLFHMASELGMRLDRIPAQSTLRKEDGKQLEVQPVDVEDLLSRPQAQLDKSDMRHLLAGKRVVVTGAGGSIGSELVLQIAEFDPASITLLDQSEYNLYEIDRVLGEEYPDLPRTAHLCNVRNADQVDSIFAEASPQVVVHAAALKHVPLLEPQPSQAVLTNIHGSRNVADASVKCGADVMVMISTDKASDPISIMGASKRVAESYAQVLDIDQRNRPNGTRFVTVRFGNVLGSAGSVVPLFQKQLEKGGPLTVTDPEMVRYFMTIREAVQLVLFASAREMKLDASIGSILVLDMGEPVRIIDMARQMIRLAGLEPDEDIEIKITGARPGERLSEPLFDKREEHLPSGHPGLLLARPDVGGLAQVRQSIDQMVDLARKSDEAAVRTALEAQVSGAPKGDVSAAVASN